MNKQHIYNLGSEFVKLLKEKLKTKTMNKSEDNLNEEVTVASLRRQGYKIRVTHKRYYGDQLFSKFEAEVARSLMVNPKFGTVPEQPNAKGGLTIVSIKPFPNDVDRKKSRISFTSGALCSKQDVFCHAKGLKAALGRALKAMEEGNV